ncbi:MAG TPA: hypothetical protein VKS25_09280 [Solirubrobacteraceae bacterium]|nr:hypothetical protein [Solirubrobacteraceae bacterium]
MSVAHQLLFGYDGGHRLLAGSRELPADTLLLLQGATDAAMNADSPALVTAVALPAADEYAFCVTWPAPEMPRAGAVWGHVLLVSAADLGDAGHFQALLGLPRRPLDAASDLASYNSPLDLGAPTGVSLEQLAPLASDRDVLERIVAAVYGSSDSAVCVHPDLAAGTRAMLAVWSGQWPKLRAGFSFRTRELFRASPSSFDLTVAAKVSGGGAVAPAAEAERTPRWVAAIVEDLLTNARTPLREFLWTFGPDGAPDRVALRRLAKLWTRVAAGDPTRVRNYLERRWPERSGGDLKYALFGAGQDRWWALDERTRVRTLVHAGGDAWDRDGLELKRRARALGIR